MLFRSDVPAGRTTVAELLAREQGDDAFLSWEEMRDVQRSGLIDFASHSLSHARVHTAPRVETFMHPGLRRGYGPLDAPWVRAAGRDLFADEIALGTPLLAAFKDNEWHQAITGTPLVSRLSGGRIPDKASGEMVEETEWHRVSFFGRLAEIAGEYLKKGRPVYIEGRLKTRKYTDKDGVEKYATEVVATEMQLLGSGRDGAGPAGHDGALRAGGGLDGLPRRRLRDAT